MKRVDPRDRGQFHRDNENCHYGGDVKVGNEIGQCVPEAANRGHQAAYRAAQPWCSAAGQRTIVRERLRETHRNAGTDGGRHPDEERFPRAVRSEGRREQRGKRRNRTIHKAGEAGLHVLQHEHASRGFILLLAGTCREDCLAELVREVLMPRLSFGEFDQQLPH